MKLIGLMVTRNDGWIIGCSARNALRWVDHLVILEHVCTDNTSEIVAKLVKEYPNRITVLVESKPDWNEVTYRQRMLDCGRVLGGTHFAIIDSDEILTSNLVPTIKDRLGGYSAGTLLFLPWLCLWRNDDQYRNDDSPFGRGKVACLFSDARDISHKPWDSGCLIHTRRPLGLKEAESITREMGGMLHYQHVNWSRLLAKQALYKAIETLRWGNHPDHTILDINSRYRATVDETGLELKDVPESWLPIYAEAIDYLAVPWQLEELRRLIALHGRKRFQGLDFFGVV